MWKYWLALIFAILALISSALIRLQYQYPFQGLKPIKPQAHSNSEKLYIYAFFSESSCPVCLGFIEVLNNLSQEFVVLGLIPNEEMKYAQRVKDITGAKFPLYSQKHYRKFMPNFIPSIIGADGKGRIYFIIPGVPELNSYLYNFFSYFHNLYRLKN